jgi:hypothetical protein
MTIHLAPGRPTPIDPATLKTDDLIDEYHSARRWHAAAAGECERIGGELANRQAEHAGQVAHAEAVWGRGSLGLPWEAPDTDRLRAELAVADQQLAQAEERLAKVRAALGRRVAKEDAAIATERAAINKDVAALAERLAHLRELTAPLLAFERYPATDGLLPLNGRTWKLGEDLRSRRAQLGQRVATLNRLRQLAAEAAGE